MGKWDALREQLGTRQKDARLSQERAAQKQEIVTHQGGNLWIALGQEFMNAVAEVNCAGKDLLSYSDATGGPNFIIKALWPKGPQVTVSFEQKSNRVKVDFVGVEGAVAHQIFSIQANDDNRAEFINQEHRNISIDEIVGQVLSRLK